MNSKSISLLFVLFCFLFSISASPVGANENLFPEIISFLESQYEAPFRVAGKVQEFSGDRLLFTKGDVQVKRDQVLWVCEHKEGISPPLQSQVAWAQVEALYPSSVLALVKEVVGREIEKNDWVLTPPAPLIHLYTNVESKHTFGPYLDLLKSLMDAGMKVREMDKDQIPADYGEADLLIRLEGDAGQLICQLKSLVGGVVLYSKTKPYGEKMIASLPVGNDLKGLRAKIAPTGMAAYPPQMASAPLFGEQGTFTRSTFRTSAPVEKTDYYRLRGAYSRVVHCDMQGKGDTELAFLGDDSVVIYRLEKGRLIQAARAPLGEEGRFPIHLHAKDLDGDGGHELLVTLAEIAPDPDKTDSRLVSRILSFKEGKIIPLIKDWPYYLRVIQDRSGVRVALAQSQGEFEQYKGPIYMLRWNAQAKKIELGEPYGPAKGIYSIYQFVLVPDDPTRVLILEPNNDLDGYYAPEERLEASGERNYGPYKETAYPIKLEKIEFVGGFDKVTCKEIYTPRRFALRTEFDGQSFLIYKERSGISDGMIKDFIKGALKRTWRAQQGEDQLVGVKWIENRIPETWKSKSMGKDVLDFTFLQNPDRILVLYRDGAGYALEAFR